MTLREQLLELTEPKYMKFTSALIPGVENVLGIRLPVLRSIAKEIAAGDWRAYLAEAEDFYFEERMLQGLVIGYARCEPAEKLAHVARFVPKIDNWAVCDCFCWRLRGAAADVGVHTTLFSRAGRIRRAFRRSHGIGQFRR